MTKHSDAQDIIEQLAEAVGSAKFLKDAHPAADTGEADSTSVTFGGIRSSINCLCTETGATENEVLLGTVAALVSRYSMADRVSLGVLGKNDGFAVFTEMIDDDTTFQDVMTDAHACLERGFADFSEVRRAAEKNGNRLGDTLSAAIDFSEGASDREQISEFELCFSFFYKDEALCADVSWDAHCFAESTITAMAGRIESLLAQAAQCLALPVSEAIMCSNAERDTIINCFNDTENECPSDKTIAQMFELQAARVPDAEALVCSGRRFTFAQLNKRANMLANTLRAKGITPNECAALITDRNAELIIGILAVLKAGGAYVWVDPKFPEDRKRFIINDCSARLLLTATADTDVLAQAVSFGKEIVDIFDESNYTGSGDNLPHTAIADDTAYILYTSGTTGRPKGVMIRNNGVTVHVASIRDGRICGYVNPEYKSFLSIAAPSYAIFPFETFMSLLNGIKVVVATDEERGSVSKINELMCREGVECFVSTPSVLRMYLSDESCCDFVKVLKIIMLAGEKLTGDIYDMVKRHSADCRMIGGYGTSEATLQATVHELDGSDGDPIPLGELADNAFGYVVDCNMNLTGIGVPGELCVGGIGVSKGYIGNDELNRAKFIPNPFGKGVLYKTGDMARWLPNGRLEGLGRRDNQIKIRGMRVELEEIESVLRGVEGVSDCAVIVKRDGLLYAFYTGELMSEEEIKAKMAERLAVHMVPSFVVHLESFVLNVNGKLDRKALQAVDVSASGNYSQTETAVQEQLCAMFREVLGVREAGIDDNFFSLGGHSLRAMTLANCIYKQFGCSLSVNDIFRAPTVRELARLLDGRVCYAEIPSAMDKEWYVCSSQQRRMYLINAKDDDSVAYNVPMVISYTGTLDRDRFRNVLGELVARHEALRTVFDLEGGKVLQRILSANAVEIPIEECELDENDLEASVKRCMRPFDLSKAPLMRVMLSQGEKCNYIVVDTHHIITDGKSANILAQELFALYEGERLEPLRVQYKDYSEWIAGVDMSADREFWLAQITPECMAPDLPTDFARAQSGGDNWGRAEEDISTGLTADIRRFCRENGVTEYMLLLSALLIVLSKYSGSEDIAVGSPVSARTHTDTEGIVGMFVNTLIMRGYPQADKDILTFINEIKKMCLDTFEHQNFPYDELTAAVGKDPCNVMFVLQNNEEMNISCGSINVMGSKSLQGVSGYEYAFEVEQRGENVLLNVKYNSSLFRYESAKRILRHFVAVIEQICADPTAKIADIEAITADEKARILGEFNDTATDYPKDKTIVELFEEQAAKTPDHAAVVFEDEQLTYAQLNARANALGAELRALGVQADDFVAIMAERSIEMMCAIFGVLKSGAAYVPIDPTYPDERIRYMLEDCAPKAIVAYKAQIETDIPVLDLADGAMWKGESENLDRTNTPDSLAYCIYTSGTTGKPKGVMIKHSNVVNYCADSPCAIVRPILERGLFTIVSVTNITFDIHVTEFIMPMLHGMTTIIANSDEQNSPEAFARLMQNHPADVLQTTPSRIKLWLGGGMGGACMERMRYIMLGGERVDISVVAAIRKYTVADIADVYGPSETTVWSTMGTVENEGDIHEIPVGKPISNTQIYIVKDTALCGIGVPGELCIVGDGLARGYLNRPELTAEKFVKNIFGEGIMYCTGDLARWLPDGNIEYLGRIDEQVKIRGFRIELGEIESRLREIAGVRDCAVIARDDASGDKAIFAYIVSDEEISVNEIRTVLSKSLPEYMIPSYMMRIDAIPVTRNGKLDKRALPEIETKSEREYVAPRNETEEMICTIFSEILDVNRVSITDSFFELGGHSLRATRLVNRIEAETGHRIALKSVFAHSTPEQLADVMAQSANEEYTHIPKAAQKQYYPMSSTQKRTYLICQMEGSDTAYNMPQILRLTGEVYHERIEQALQSMVDRHEILRTRFFMHEGEPMQEILPTVLPDYEYIENSTASEEEIAKDFVQPFDLGSARLVRVRLVKRAENWMLMFDMHHIVGDGMSMGTFIKEFCRLYNDEALPEITHQYKDYSEWMRDRDLSEQKNFWTEQFSDDIPVLDMPLDYSRPQEQSYKGATICGGTGGTLYERIKALSAKTGATEYMIFLTAAIILLSKYSRCEDIVIGSPVSARTHRDTENMLGMFVNTLAMRGRPEGAKTCEQFLEEIKSLSLKAYENQEYPFEELVEAVKVTRDFSRSPLFDVMLIMQNNEQASMRLNGITAEEISPRNDVAKFDMTFHITEQSGEFSIGVEYCTALFKVETAERILHHLNAILEQICADPTAKIANIETITVDEKAQILGEFNDTAADYPKDKTIVELFEEQAAKTPDHTAVVFEEEQLTYAQLNARANALSAALRALGVKPDDFVAIMAERSIEMMCAIFGILKSGAAYVPIDPTYPDERIRYMLEDCAPKAIVVYKAQIETDIPVIDLADGAVWEGASENLACAIAPNNRAYCIYTSGSTGKPKGVAITHQNVVNYCADSPFSVMRPAFEKQLRSIVSVTNLTFDIHVTEFILPMLHGMMVIIADKSEQESALAFARLMERHPACILQTTPSRIKMWLSAGGRSDCLGCLRYIMLGGERVDRQLIAQMRKYTDASIADVYGPSETTVWSTVWQIPEGELPREILIGNPITNTAVSILSQSGRECGIGVPGELCILGEGVAEGYVNRPELTEQRFVRTTDGRRMYKTGDLAAWCADGNIRFIGRVDDQVKINGNRVEIGEIESVLLALEGVSDAAVTLNTDGDRDILCAYVVTDGPIDIGAARAKLVEQLPAHMIPVRYMQVPAMPLTASGKIAKKLLPPIEVGEQRAFVEAKTEKEKLLAELLCEVLGIDKVSMNDNFFELGGNSMKSVVLITLLERRGLMLTLRDIRKSATVGKLARCICYICE